MKRVIAIFLLLVTPSLALSPYSVRLSWDASPDQIELTYALYGGTNAGDYSKRIAVGTNLTTQVTGLTPGRWYFVCVAVTYEGVESLPSNEVSFTVPGAPGSLRARPPAQKAVRMPTLR